MRERFSAGSGQPQPALPGGQPLVADSSGTYSIESRARLADGRESVLAGRGAHGRERCAGIGLHAAALGGGNIATLITLRDALGRSSARWLGGDGFLAWWGRSLAAWLPRAGGRRWAWAAAACCCTCRSSIRHCRLASLAPCNCGCRTAMACATSASIPGLAGAGADDDPLATVLAPALADLPRWLLLPASRGAASPAAAAGRRRRTPARRGAASRSSARRRSQPMRSRSTHASSIAASATASSMSNWWWCHARRWTRNSRRSGRWPQAWPASMSPPPTRRWGSTCWPRRDAGSSTIRGGCGTGCWSPSPLLAFAAMLWQMLDNRRAAADALQRSHATSGSRRRARCRSNASSWSTWSRAAHSSIARAAAARPRSRSSTNSAAACPTTPIWKNSRSRTTTCC